MMGQATTMKPKVDIYGGKNPRDLPLYSVAEAARVVRVNGDAWRLAKRKR